MSRKPRLFQARVPAPSVESLEAVYHLEALNLGLPVRKTRCPALPVEALAAIRNYDPLADNLVETWTRLAGLGVYPEEGRPYQAPSVGHKNSGRPFDERRFYIGPGDRMIYYEPANAHDGDPLSYCALSWVVAFLGGINWPPAIRHLTYPNAWYIERASRGEGMYPPMTVGDLEFARLKDKTKTASKDPVKVALRQVLYAMRLVVPIDDIREALPVNKLVDHVSRFCPDLTREQIAFYCGQHVYACLARYSTAIRWLSSDYRNTLFYSRSPDGAVFQSTRFLEPSARQFYQLPPYEEV